LLERVGLVSQAREVQAERVEPQPVAVGAQGRPAAGHKAALKRTGEKSDAGAAAKLKEKGQASAALKDAKQRDLTQLKAKLGEPKTKTKRAPAPAKHGPAAGKPASGNGAPIASTPEVPAKKANAQPPPATTPSHCRIEWRRTGNQSQFCAITRSPTGDKSVLLSSPLFKWKDDTPPRNDFAPAGSAYLALVAQLAAEGWVATDLGERWYALELKRTTEHLQSTNGEEGRR
jgi:hypothetical protein